MATYELYADKNKDEIVLVLRMNQAEFNDLCATSEAEDAEGHLDGMVALVERLLGDKGRLQ